MRNRLEMPRTSHRTRIGKRRRRMCVLRGWTKRPWFIQCSRSQTLRSTSRILDHLESRSHESRSKCLYFVLETDRRRSFFSPDLFLDNKLTNQNDFYVFRRPFSWFAKRGSQTTVGWDRVKNRNVVGRRVSSSTKKK